MKKFSYSKHLRLWLATLAGCFILAAHAQPGAEVRIQGKVTDKQLNPIVGVVVAVQERQAGTTTASDGSFSILARIGETLEVSYLGYKKQQFKVTRALTGLDIVLEEDALSLDDVVVVGYGSTSKEKLTGAIATVSTSDFKNRPITDVSLALQGKVTGVQVTQTSGQPGADSGTITVRGIGTLNDSSPLIIIDGFESSFDKVDPKDIESISVLKDAASAAIYGNKAANGVILITTKKGRSGQLSVEYNGYVSVQQVTRYPELLGAVDYMTLYNEACLNSGQQLRYSQSYIDHFDGSDPALYPDRDWADFYFKPAVMHNHYVKLTGGSEQLAYTLSMGYLGQDGILEGTEFDKYSFRMNASSSLLNDRLKISTNIAGYSGVRTDLVDGTGNTLYRIVAMTPMVNARMEGYGWTDWFYDDAAREAGGYNQTDIGNFSGNINIQLSLLKNLKLEGAVNFDRTTETGQIYAPDVELYTVFTGADGSQTIGESNSRESSITESTYRYGNLSSYVTLSYWATTGENHHFKAMAGWQQGQWNNKYYKASRTRLTTNLPSLEVGDPATQKNSSWETEVTSLSLFGRFNYDYKEKYLFEANVRYDGSSKFAAGHKWGLFPSFSAGWRISEEKFMQDVRWIDELKLRASWGQLGNEKIWSSYAGIDILSIGSCNYIWENQQVTGAATSYIANKDLTWETTTQYNVGVDFRLFGSLSFTGDFYVKETDDILMQLPVSGIFGFTEDPWKNAGRMRNVGCEFALAYNKTFREWEFSAGASISFNRNEILDLKGQSPILNSTTGIILEEGRPINTLYGYAVEGIYQSDEEIHNHLQTFDRDGNPVNSYSGLIAAPGDIRFKDQNGDGIIDMDHDRVALGDPNPDFLYSFNLGARWKGLDVTAFFQGVYGGEGWSSGELVSPFFNGYNSAAWMTKRWTPEKPNNTYQRVYIDSQRAAIKSAYYVEDLSYLRLKNFEIGYTFPREWLAKIRISGLRVFVSGQNLFTLTRYKGFDPERAGVNATNIYDYPLVRTFTAGLNVTF